MRLNDIVIFRNLLSLLNIVVVVLRDMFLLQFATVTVDDFKLVVCFQVLVCFEVLACFEALVV